MLRINLLLLILISTVAFGQRQKTNGLIMANDGPLVGASIVEKGKVKTGVLSDSEGKFSISTESNATLIISYVGYVSKEIAISNAKFLNITLDADSKSLKEVSVQGFSGVVGQARRRSENVQKIPESVVTMTSKDIQAAGITNIQSFAGLVPNVSFSTSQNVGVNFITVRGIPTIRNGDAPVAFIVDGVTVPDANLINQELYDLAMVEIVKGPQGALYGKNAIAGAINILTNKPTNSFQNNIMVGYGNGNSLKTRVSFSGPLVKDKLFYRASASYNKSDGLITNIVNNKKVDYLNDLNLRGQLKFQASPSFSATLSSQMGDLKGGGLYYAVNPKGDKFSPSDVNTAKVMANVDGYSTVKTNWTNLKLENNGEKLHFQSITSYTTGKRYHFGDLDFREADILRQEQNSDSKTIGQEFRLGNVNENSKLNWDLGMLIQKVDKRLYTNVPVDFGWFGNPPKATGTFNSLGQSDFTNHYNTVALFGFVDYKLTDKLTAAVGLRFDNDKITQDNLTTKTNLSTTKAILQPKLSLSYQASDNVLTFVNYGKGYRQGGFNSGATALFNAQYEAETTDNYEWGLKTNFLNQRVIFNTSIFYTNFTNQQQYGLSLAPPQILIGNYNYPKSKVWGYEFDVKFRATNYLDILANYGYNNSKILEGGKAGTTNRSNFDGKYVPFVPQSNFSIGLQSNFKIADKTEFNGFLNLQEKGRIYWAESNADYSKPYSLLNARFGLTFSKKYTVNIWGNNITNTKYWTEYYPISISGGSSDLAWPNKPASYGLELNIKF